MQAIAIIVEYNPLHNGHLYHLQETKKRFPDASIIAILNGNFLQRGEPALLNKYQRTRLALQAGVDLVVELPFAFGTQRADIFARGAIQIAQGLNAGAIIYGSEQIATPRTPIKELKPNERLGYFYKQAIRELGAQVEPIAIPRHFTQYNQTTIDHASFASASALRAAILQGDISQLANYMPDYVLSVIQNEHMHLGHIEQYFPYLQYTLSDPSSPTVALSQSGLGENMTHALATSDTFSKFFSQVHHKHTSRTHIQRALTYRLTRTTQSSLDEATQHIWTRTLGASSMGQKYLKYLKTTNRLHVPLIAKINDLPAAHYKLQYNSLIAYATITNSCLAQALIQENSNNIIR